jgi:GntR family transcriptional regulator/MocR family aminotransferase
MALDESGAVCTDTEADVLHISPGHQFPTGIVMPIVRRRQLMAWAAEGDRWIIEDDYDSEFRFSGTIVPTMYSMDSLGRVIYLNTFSRTITPALRISYMILPPVLMERYHRLLGFYSCTVPSFEQLTLARFLDEGYFEKHVSRMKRHYRLLRDSFLSLLRQSPLSGRMQIQGDEAGLHFLLRLQTDLPDEIIEAKLAKAGIRAAGLCRYQTDLPHESVRGRVVIQYADLAEADLPKVIALLEEIAGK